MQRFIRGGLLSVSLALVLAGCSGGGGGSNGDSGATSTGAGGTAAGTDFYLAFPDQAACGGARYLPPLPQDPG